MKIETLTRSIGSVTIRASLEIKAGECVALQGPSGCGKTSLLRMIAGLDRPRSGRVILQGIDVTSWPAHRRQIATVFQYSAFIPSLSLIENAELGLQVRGIKRSTRRALLSPYFERLGLGGRENSRPGELSGGERQRLAWIRALVWKPNALLLDEPLTGLDDALKQTLRECLQDELRARPFPVLWVTHDALELGGLRHRELNWAEISLAPA